MNDNIEKITCKNKTIYLVKTAHVSKLSIDDVNQAIDELRPDAICIELDEDRLKTLSEKDTWRNTDIVTIIKEKRVGLLLVNIILSAYQKRLAKKMDTDSGGEMLAGIKKAKDLDIPLVLADRNITITFKRIWQSLGLTEKLKLIYTIVFSLFDDEDISEKELQELKQADMLESALNEVGKSFPNVKRVLVDERDMYLSQKIKNAPGQVIVAIIGAAHSLGIKKYIEQEIDTRSLVSLKKKSGLLSNIIKWSIPLILIGMVIYSLFINQEVGLNQIKNWFILNGGLGALGALLVLAHPLTILTAFVAAPFTAINPLLAVGWFAGLVEAYIKKPQVKDFEDLANDASTFKGFMKNRVSHILLVVIMSNLFCSIGSIIGSVDIIASFLGLL